jgi:ribosome recycling factor
MELGSPMSKEVIKEQIKKNIKPEAEKVIKSYQVNLQKLRSSRANPAILDGVIVDYYGTPSPLKQVAQVTVPEARVLQIQPFDRSLLAVIERSIINSNIGITPSNDGIFIRIPFPALTEDKRKQIVKDLKKITEDHKVQIRNIRRDQLDIVKLAEKDKKISEDDVKKLGQDIQHEIDNHINQIDKISADKEKEILAV